ncbi:MAG: PINc/VapC family ATPase [Candidatus Nezhaarchaeales archaeon]|nr:MAG: ATPase [Candidatus Nezhaarchaeota archaeon WYZ-LMO8]TDA37027.1 MAG: ATPase [Candidatus Nezhaarchaeota archaeon WYZ-LMO7]
MTYSGVYVPDLLAIETGVVRRLVEDGVIKDRLVVHRAIISELERRARFNDFSGLEELSSLRRTCESKGVKLALVGEANGGKKLSLEALNEMIRELALDLKGTLITCDVVMAKVAEAMGINVLHVKPEGEMKLEEFFDNRTMSVHLKEGVVPYAKRGQPGKWTFEPIRSSPMTREELQTIITEIMEKARSSPDGFIEVDRESSTIVQLGSYRIVITRPPFSDGLELTAVRPIVKLKLEDYNLPPKLIERLDSHAEGILIAGAPGMGKSTFAQALAEYYKRKNKVVKTIEAPRDLQLPQDITQYSKSVASSQEIHDVLLLSRPDYTIFDEMRDTEDFKLYADLRLAGVGMVGVVHATSPIDAIQRFVGRVELGMIPSIVDTVLFISEGNVKKVYSIETTIKIPHGLKEEDLARPVVMVKDFLTDEPEYELYVFGERTFVVPVKRGLKVPSSVVTKALEHALSKVTPDFELEMPEEGVAFIYVPRHYLPLVMKKCRKKLDRISKRFDMHIEVRPMA